MEELSGQICQICGDEIEITVDREPFVACNECAFPVCRTCYEYERSEGTQACPHCRTRYKRIRGFLFCFFSSLLFEQYFLCSSIVVILLKDNLSFEIYNIDLAFVYLLIKISVNKIAGSPRVEGDEEEDDIDDLEHEFDYGNVESSGGQPMAASMLSAGVNNRSGSHTNTYGVTSGSEMDTSPLDPEIPLLTYGEEVRNAGILLRAVYHMRTFIFFILILEYCYFDVHC